MEVTDGNQDSGRYAGEKRVLEMFREWIQKHLIGFE